MGEKIINVNVDVSEEEFAMINAVRSGRFWGGPYIDRFERELAKYMGVRRAVFCNSGSSALMLAVSALHLPRETKVVTQALAFPTAINALVQNGLKPVFIDVELDTLNVNPDLVIEAMEKTEAPVFLLTHTIGNCTDMKKLSEGLNSLPEKHSWINKPLWIEDSCLAPETPIFMADGYTKPIAGIKEGDYVLTHSGSQRVTKAHVRIYKGKILKIKPALNRIGFRVTPEHPILAIDGQRHRITLGQKKLDVAPEMRNASWKRACDLDEHDYLVFPRPSLDKHPVTETLQLPMRVGRAYSTLILPISTQFCKLLGYYVAEGSTSHDKVWFTFNRQERNYIDEVKELTEKVFHRTVHEKPKGNGTNLYFNGRFIARTLEEVCGHGARNKKVPSFIYNASFDQKRAFLEALFAGDAEVNKQRLGYIRFKVSSSQLADGVYLLLASLGVPSAVSRHDPTISSIGGRFANFGPSFQVEVHTRGRTARAWIDENAVYYPTRKIEVEDYDGLVYNLAVENEEHYLTYGCTLHNCDNFGSKFAGKFLGTWANISCTSFHPAHQMTCGLGGACFTNDVHYGERMAMMRDWGRIEQIGLKDRFVNEFDMRYFYPERGFNFQGTEVCAAMGCVQLKKLDGFNQIRRKNFATLKDFFSKYKDRFIIPREHPDAEVAWFGYPVIRNPEYPWSVPGDEQMNIESLYGGSLTRKKTWREPMMQAFESKGIQCRSIYGGTIIKQLGYKTMDYAQHGELKNSDYLSNNAFWIGCYHGLSEEQVKQMCERIEVIMGGI